MAGISATVPYELLHDPGNGERYDQKGIENTLVFLVDWADRFTFLNQVLYTPDEYPGLPKCYADSAVIHGDGKPSHNSVLNMIQWEKARITVTFKTRATDKQNDGTLLAKELDIGAQFITIPGAKYYWTGTTDPIQENPGRVIPAADFSLQQKYVGSLDLSLYMGLAGKLNAATFYGQPPEYVLYAGARAKREAKANGGESWDVTHKFMVKPRSWNELLKPPATGGGAAVWTKTDPRIYETADFLTLNVGT